MLTVQAAESSCTRATPFASLAWLFAASFAAAWQRLIISKIGDANSGFSFSPQVDAKDVAVQQPLDFSMGFTCHDQQRQRRVFSGSFAD